MRFRTERSSDSRFGSTGLQFITIKTPNLKGRGDICVFTPNGNVSQTELPIVILLHGVYGSSWSWALSAGAHISTQQLIDEQKIKPMVLVMPSDGLWGDGSAYLPHNGYDFEKWIVEDVVDAVRLNVSQCINSTVTFISGLSMGGFGALRLGAKYPSIFKAFAGHSAITSLSQMDLFVEESVENFQQPNQADHDVFQTMEINAQDLNPFRFDCGQGDLLIKHNRTLHRQLTEANIDHIYQEFEGKHEWAYWEEHLADSLSFFNNYL